MADEEEEDRRPRPQRGGGRNKEKTGEGGAREGVDAGVAAAAAAAAGSAAGIGSIFTRAMGVGASSEVAEAVAKNLPDWALRYLAVSFPVVGSVAGGLRYVAPFMVGVAADAAGVSRTKTEAAMDVTADIFGAIGARVTGQPHTEAAKKAVSDAAKSLREKLDEALRDQEAQYRVEVFVVQGEDGKYHPIDCTRILMMIEAARRAPKGKSAAGAPAQPVILRVPFGVADCEGRVPPAAGECACCALAEQQNVQRAEADAKVSRLEKEIEMAGMTNRKVRPYDLLYGTDKGRAVLQFVDGNFPPTADTAYEEDPENPGTFAPAAVQPHTRASILVFLLRHCDSEVELNDLHTQVERGDVNGFLEALERIRNEKSRQEAALEAAKAAYRWVADKADGFGRMPDAFDDAADAMDAAAGTVADWQWPTATQPTPPRVTAIAALGRHNPTIWGRIGAFFRWLGQQFWF